MQDEPDLNVPASWSLGSGLGLFTVVALPVVLAMAGGGFAAVLLGALAWGVAVAVKFRVGPALVHKGQRAGVTGLVQGLLSAVLELGAAALVLWYLAPGTAVQVLAFGAGAAAVEVFYVLIKGALEKTDPATLARWHENARASLCVRYSAAIERWAAALGHMGSRGLIWIALVLGTPAGLWPALLALAGFTLVDGVATYGSRMDWDWLKPSTSRRSSLFFTAVGALELAAFQLWAYLLGLPWGWD